MNSTTRFREIEVSGPPREMGRQLGEAAREQICGFAEIALQRLNKTVKISRSRAIEIAQRCTDYAEAYDAQMVEELRGVAEGSGVSLDDLMLLQVRNQLQEDSDSGCTSFAVSISSSTQHHNFVAQNWDNDPALDPFTIVLTRRPAGRPALLNVTQAGLIGYIGLNDMGMGVCLNTLPGICREVGVPHYFTVRAIYQTTNLMDAVKQVRRAHRAISANILMATPQGPADLEVTLEEVYLLTDPQRLTHTNHCLHSDLLEVNDQFPELIESRPRKDRIDALFEQSGATISLDQMKDMLRDHDRYPTSICRHTNDDPQYGFWATVFSVIIDTEAGEMHVSRGTPCEHPYETYRLNGASGS